MTHQSMDRSEIIAAADSAVLAASASRLEGRSFSLKRWIADSGLPVLVAHAGLRYGESQGWFRIEYVIADPPEPDVVFLTNSGMSRADELHGTARKSEAAPSVVVHAPGIAPTINVNSTDNSSKVFNINADNLFAGIEKQVLESNEDAGTKQFLIAGLRELKAAPAESRLLKAYALLAAAANVTTILDPHAAALMAFAKGLVGS